MCFLSALLTWRPRRWLAAVVGGLLSFAVLGLSTAVIPNPVFGRSIAPTEWAMEVLVITSVLSGLLFASYVRNEAPVRQSGGSGSAGTLAKADRDSRLGAAGGLLAYLAIGCPVCNKVVLIALGSTGAVQFFAPIQPYMGVLGIGLLTFALVFRLSREAACALPKSKSTPSAPAPDSPVAAIQTAPDLLPRPEPRPENPTTNR